MRTHGRRHTCCVPQRVVLFESSYVSAQRLLKVMTRVSSAFAAHRRTAKLYQNFALPKRTSFPTRICKVVESDLNADASHTQIWRNAVWLRRRALEFSSFLRGYATTAFRQGYALNEPSTESSCVVGRAETSRQIPSATPLVANRFAAPCGGGYVVDAPIRSKLCVRRMSSAFQTSSLIPHPSSLLSLFIFHFSFFTSHSSSSPTSGRRRPSFARSTPD